MKRLTILLTVLLLSGSASAQLDSTSVECLVSAVDNWCMSSDTAGWTKRDYLECLRQTQRGEIIVVMPSGWNWGRMERPPSSVVVKIQGVSLSQAQKYLEPLIDSVSLVADPNKIADSVRVKERRFFFPKRFIDSALTLWEVNSSYAVLTKAQVLAAVKEYDIPTIRQLIRRKRRK